MKTRAPRSNQSCQPITSATIWPKILAYLARLPQKQIAAEIGISERRWGDIARGRTKPRPTTAERIREAARARRLDQESGETS